jgi:hypothetical protein
MIQLLVPNTNHSLIAASASSLLALDYRPGRQFNFRWFCHNWQSSGRWTNRRNYLFSISRTITPTIINGSFVLSAATQTLDSIAYSAKFSCLDLF